MKNKDSLLGRDRGEQISGLDYNAAISNNSNVSLPAGLPPTLGAPNLEAAEQIRPHHVKVEPRKLAAPNVQCKEDLGSRPVDD